MSTPTSIRLAPPEVEGRTVRFRWSVTPEPSLYRATSFTLTYPESVDVAAVPEAVWWRVALCCLHSQWVLLRPCRVVLPVRLPPGEAEAWLRLCDAQQATLEGNAGGDDDRRAIELIEAGPELTEGVPPRPDGPAVACFSGGRDSLVQAALLVELGSPPALVTVSAAREGSVEHDHPRRTRALRAIQERRSLELIEVTSDLRMCFRNDAAVERYGVGVTELVDTFLYFGAALGVAAARGAPTVFLASEAEVQDNARNGGMIIQHRHAMYSGVAQRALSAILAPAGFSYDGLTASLRQFHVQRLLSERYVDLRDLQFSCWSQTREQAACSACSECRGIALNLLADDVDPATAGIDLATLLPAQEAWRPRVDEFGSVRNVGRRASDLHTVRRLAGLEPARIEAALAVQGAPAPAQKEALTAYTRLRTAALELVPEPGPEPGYRTGFLALQPASRRAVLERIIAEHVAPEPEEEHEEVLARANALVDWITAPLGRRSRVPAAPGVPSAERPVRPRPPDPAPPTEAELAGYRHLIPGREPVLAAPAGRRVLRVAETLLDGNERAYVDECIDGNWISSAGSFVGRFEQAFAQASGCAYGVA
nr:hypothetical protein [Solirubrobacterales bacterium]